MIKEILHKYLRQDDGYSNFFGLIPPNQKDYIENKMLEEINANIGSINWIGFELIEHDYLKNHYSLRTNPWTSHKIRKENPVNISIGLWLKPFVRECKLSHVLN